jgi:transcriptional regulator with XRE-family HTH domain
VEIRLPHAAGVPRLRKQLGEFLRKRRGELTLTQFARKLGIAASSLHRLELGEQNVTLDTLEQILKRLRCTLADVIDAPAK